MSGDFQQFHGVIIFDEANLQDSKFDVQIDVSSIRTGNWLKTKHAKGKKWFSADQWPRITFKSRAINKTTTGYEVTGVLDMHGITKDITIPFTFENYIFKSQFSVNRTDFNIGKVTGMAKSVGREIVLDISVPVSQ